ncbi:TIGR01621 family pseudouridine synthase [Cellvibrio fibrivorans]|uniref:tRNA pseudouridine32 synthase/23S rRNA pseudouridine746 synthase n=1 Tax=Cellvibrio fibrivorans TaxID=126350 RepID=A0ABU1UVX0_9GAMM|nr:TIGR01621 family pseudouridine synthase [Cellvibrio fibrivorans]MDR7089311.1 tRNA pseudouridine32 synthase/23S rRNA pseudouridine746 synthase [Cellvibrio fibrivorans]
MYDIVENNPEFVVIYKKPGASFHSESGEPGLFETVKQQEGFCELFPVHRLDKITSGLLVMAKTPEINRQLTDAFSRRQIQKYYLAVSAKKPNKKQGLIKGDMAPARRGAWKLITAQDNPAITQFFSKSISPGHRLFMVKPHTGKTHQIRVALKSIGSPIAGDSLYGDSIQSAGYDRCYLHAYSLTFVLGGKHYRFTELPREGDFFCDDFFTAAIQEWREPWLLPWPQLLSRTQKMDKS